LPTQYKAAPDDLFITTEPITVTPTGGDGPFLYKWSSSDPSVLFLYNGTATALPKIQPKTKSVTITCTVTDSSIPVRQVASADTLVRVVGGLNLEGTYGQAYRLYRAAFDRLPDQAGIDYWTAQLNAGMSLLTAASCFILSTEFRSMYGEAPTDDQFITLLYKNVLHREPDAGGWAYWMNAMTHGLTQARVLVEFSESPENKANV
jgi:hypothetical protein